MRELPTGTVTFLFTDIEGSTQLLQELGDAYTEELAWHRRLLREAFTRHRGTEVDTQGDAFFVAFARAADAVAAAEAAQRKLAKGPIRVRMGIHTGEPAVTEEGYVGLDVHRAARICAAAHGGQVVLSERARTLLDSEPRLTDLGRHRLKDLSEPERLHQLGGANFPPLRSLNATNLPVQPSPLVGRQRELAEVLHFVQSERLVTLTGAGGSGKTRLALQVAAEVTEEFKDGVFWVSLSTITNPELALPTIAATVGAKDDLARFVDEKRLLLLLDNLEQILDCAPALAELLRSCPKLTLLVTSRAPLRISGEQEYEVQPLPEADAAVLFMQRARQVKPGFEADEHVGKICRRLDGLPLALELAAARMKLLSPQQILERLGHSLDLLTTGARDLPERQRTLRATIEWSYELLERAEKQLFARLAVFAGSLDLDAAESVADADVDTLEALIDKSLIRQTHEGRYFMLETIGEYARERLDELGEMDELRRGLADFYLTRVESVEEQLFGTEQRRALDGLEADFDNLRAVIDWALERGKIDVVLRMAGALDLFWHARGHVAEAARWLETALREGTNAAPLTRAKALYSLASIAALNGDHARAELLLDDSLEVLQALPESWELSYALAVKAEVVATRGDLGRARESAESAVAVARRVGDWYRTIFSLDRLANVAFLEGDSSEARRLSNEALIVAREARQARPIARSLASLGWLAVVDGDCAEAATLCEEGLGLIRGTNDPKVTCELLQMLGLAVLGVGDQRRSGDALREALIHARALGSYPYMRFCFDGLAAACADHDPRRCALLLGAADALVEATGDQRTKHEQTLFEQYVRRARFSLGEKEWSAVRAEGRAKPVDEAIEDALEPLD
jgi:predicted ATPase/class 3 adenylate cyclase